ncbi:MAG: M4 family metallopeptidase, partial [Polyangiaceae bacterium]|nr:M4 family metallopeptidase [Polyangiaceae bacterium]
HCPVRVVAHIGMDANAYFDKYSEWDTGLNANKYYGYIAFYDGLADSGGNVTYDFMAGDPVIFAHEYQHAITFFGAAKSTGEPGHIYGGASSGKWTGTIREGLSDSIACLRTGLWTNPPAWPVGARRSGEPFRRIEYPRSTLTYDGDWYCDHYDDIDSTKDKYFHSTLLSHVAFLVGQGGVHQRVGRSPELIPVKGIGTERTAHIFLYALTQFFDTLPITVGSPILIEAAQLLLDAARDVGGSELSCEFVTMRRALYAVGLYPYDASYVKQTYGAEACMLPWIWDVRFSQPYVGLPATYWQSPDLFVNNGAGIAYDANIGEENNLFARVRNVGDEDMTNVTVRFYFAPAGTNLPASIAGWHPCKDLGGTDCVLTIAALAAGDVNIANPNSPPADQAVRWYLDPTYVTPEVDHFCVRAVVSAAAPNNTNNCPNEVQSNVQHVMPDELDKITIGFNVHNWGKEPIPADIRVEHTLGEGVRVVFAGKTPLRKLVLKPKSKVPLQWKLALPPKAPARMEPPYNGRVSAKLSGAFTGTFEGELSEARVIGVMPALVTKKPSVKLEGALSGTVKRGAVSGALHGKFKGTFDLRLGKLAGTVVGGLSLPGQAFEPQIKIRVEGALEPLRAIHFTQLINGKATGGITVRIKPPKLRSAVRDEEPRGQKKAAPKKAASKKAAPKKAASKKAAPKKTASKKTAKPKKRSKK